MTSKRFVELLQQTVNSEDIRSYSGRAMYGASCVAVTLERDDNEYAIIARVMREVIGMIDDISDDNDEGREEILKEANDLVTIFSSSRTDQLGLGMIIYWPSMKWTSDLDLNKDENLDQLETE